jgi:hypothetical protein
MVIFMQISLSVQDILNKIAKLCGLELIPVMTSESSMLPTKVKEMVEENYRTVLVPKYQDKMKQMGGVDGVLENLEMTIVSQLNGASSSNLGEISRSGKASRQLFADSEIGRGHTALRLLLDEDNLGPNAYPNLLHKGSQAKFNSINFRELLAYYWLAASDPAMEVVKEFADENREQIISFSISNFIDQLYAIRRAHNKGILINSNLDYPSCSPGTFGRIAARSSVYNVLSALPILAIQEIPAEIQNFILDAIKNASVETQAALFGYISKKTNFEEVSQIEENCFNDFVLNVRRQRQEIENRLRQKIKGLFINGTDVIMDHVMEILKIELNKIAMNNNKDLPDSEFIFSILKVSASAYQNKLYKEKISQEVKKYRIELRDFDSKLQALCILITNEICQANLLTQYRTNPRYETNINALLKLVNEYEKLFEDGTSAFNNMLTTIRELTNKECLEIMPMINFPKIETDMVLPDSTKARLQKIKNNLEKIKELIESSKKVDYSKNITEWAKHIIRLNTLKDEDGNYICCENTLITLLQGLKSREEDFKARVLEEIKKQLDGNKISKEERDKIQTILNSANVFAYQVQLEEIEFIDLASIQEQFAKLSGSEENSLGPKCVLNLIGAPDSKEDYEIWKKCLQDIMDGKHISSNNTFEVLYHFILLTVFNNLEIAQISKSDADTLKEICSFYLYPESSQAKKVNLPYEFDENTPLQQRLDYLAGHLKCVLTSLKNIRELFHAGGVRLMTREKSEELIAMALKEHKPAPYILRLGISKPNNLVISSSSGSGSPRHMLYGNNQKPNLELEIEGQRIGFVEISLNSILGYLTSKDAHLHFKTLITAKQGFAEIIANKEAIHNAYVSTSKYRATANSYKNSCIKFGMALYEVSKNLFTKGFFAPNSGNGQPQNILQNENLLKP